jgi:hypothetical protein
VEDKEHLRVLLDEARAELQYISREEGNTLSQLAAAEADRDKLALSQTDPPSLEIVQRLEMAEAAVKRLNLRLADYPTERVKMENFATICELSEQYGRWVVIRPAVSEVKITFHCEGVLGALPVKASQWCSQLGDLLLAALKTGTPQGRMFYLAPVIAVDDVTRQPLPMSDDAFREYKGLTGPGKSGKEDRVDELDAWRHLIISWNRAFPNKKVLERENGFTRSRSSSASSQPSVPSQAKPEAGPSAPPHHLVTENRDLAARIRFLEEEVRALRFELAGAEKLLEDSNPLASCPMCPHCYPREEQKSEKEKEVAFRPPPKKASKEAPPISKPKGKEVERGTAKGGNSPAPSNPPGTDQRENKSLISLADAKLIRQALGKPHLDSVEGLTQEEKNDYYGRAKIPNWAIRGYVEIGAPFLEEIKSGRVSATNFNDWLARVRRPSRAQLVAEWTSIRKEHDGVKLNARPATASEQRLRGAYLKLRSKCEKLGEVGVVPAHLPDRGPSRSRSRGRSASRGGAERPPKNPVGGARTSTIGSMTPQELADMMSAAIAAALAREKK